MTDHEKQWLADTLTEKLRPCAEAAAERRADEVLSRLLGADQSDIQHKVREALKQVITSELSARILVQVVVKP